MKFLHSTDAAPSMAHYSHGVEIGANERLVICSGQLGISRTGDIPDSVREQTLLCFENAEAILAKAGLDRRHVAKLTAYVTDRAHLTDYMTVRDAFFKDQLKPPASTLLIVSGFSRQEFKVEVEVVACAGGMEADE
jgi:enamine deaminase RidA (YjgF/YER057c/UK114 family)